MNTNTVVTYIIGQNVVSNQEHYNKLPYVTAVEGWLHLYHCLLLDTYRKEKYRKNKENL